MFLFVVLLFFLFSTIANTCSISILVGYFSSKFKQNGRHEMWVANPYLFFPLNNVKPTNNQSHANKSVQTNRFFQHNSCNSESKYRAKK